MRRRVAGMSSSVSAGRSAPGGRHTCTSTLVPVTFPRSHIQAPAFPVNAVVHSTAFTMNIFAISSGTACAACDSCRRNLDANSSGVWLGEQTSAAGRDRTGAGGNSSCTRYPRDHACTHIPHTARQEIASRRTLQCIPSARPRANARSLITREHAEEKAARRLGSPKRGRRQAGERRARGAE